MHAPDHAATSVACADTRVLHRAGQETDPLDPQPPTLSGGWTAQNYFRNLVNKVSLRSVALERVIFLFAFTLALAK